MTASPATGLEAATAPGLEAAAPDPARPRRTGLAALQFLAAGLIGGLWIGYTVWQGAALGVAADFVPFYSAGTILRAQGPHALYDSSAMREHHRRNFPYQQPVLPFIRPPFYALALATLTFLPPRPALVVWLAVNVAALAAALFFISRALRVAWSTVTWHAAIFFPAVYAIFNRQDVPLVLLLAALGYWLLARGSSFAAGLVLALCSIKFHLLLLIPVVFLAKRNWRALQGLAVGAAALLLISLLMLGPAGLAGYAGMLIHRTPPSMEFPQRFANLSNLAAGTWIRIPLVLLAIGAAIAAALRLPPLEALACAWLGSLLIAPHVYLSDYLLALPALLLLAGLGPVCLWSSLLILFPVTPVLMVYSEKASVLLIPLMALVCLAAAAFRPRPVALPA